MEVKYIVAGLMVLLGVGLFFGVLLGGFMIHKELSSGPFITPPTWDKQLSVMTTIMTTSTIPYVLNLTYQQPQIVYITIPVYQQTSTTSTLQQVTTTTSLVHRNPAPMFGLFERGQMETQDYRCYLNYTVTSSKKTNSGVIKRVVEAPDCDDLVGFFTEIEGQSGYGLDKKVTSIWFRYNNGTVFNVWGE